MGGGDGRSSTGYYAMDMRMMLEGLAPGVQNSGNPKLRAKMFGIGTDSGECFGRGAKQDGVNDGFVLVGDRTNVWRQSEHNMEVRDWQKIRLPVGKPLGARSSLALRTMAIATRVVGNAGCAAVIALLEVAAERGRPARRDGAHDAALDATEMTGVGTPKRFAVAAEDIRHLQTGSHEIGSAGWDDLQSEPVERAWCIADCFGGNLGITHCTRHTGVSQQYLDDTHVRTAFQKMGCKSMA